MTATVASLKVGNVVCYTDGFGPKTWTQTLGVQAPSITWLFSVQDAAKILAGPRETSITMTDASGKTKTIQRVYVVGEEATNDALIRGVIFTDVRFYLPFGQVRSNSNLKAQSGTFRQLQNDLQPQAAQPPTIQNWTFVPSSLKKEQTPWNAFEIAQDVLQQACTGHDFPPITLRFLANQRTSFIPNDVFVDAMGHMAIAQALGALGGLDIRVADDGAIELVNAFLGAEKSTVDPIVSAYSLEWKGLLRWISMANRAPTAGLVRLTRRVEVRADSWEGPPGPTGNASTVGDDVTWGTDNTPTMINVIPVTDQSIPYPSKTDPSVQNTLVPTSAFLQAIASLNDAPPGTPQAWTPISRKLLLQGPGGVRSASPLLSEMLEGTYVSDHGTGVGANASWALRCQALRNYFRTLYKLNPIFARQCLPGSIKAERVGLLDAATGTYQTATVYADHVQRPRGPGFSTDDAFGWIVNSVPPNNPNTQVFPSGQKTYAENPGPYNVSPFPISQATVAPFQTQVYDATNGVFYFSGMAQDMTKVKHAADVHMGLVWNLPSNAIGELYHGTTFAFWSQAQKLLTHRVALIFSAIPAGPNGPKALHPFKVTVAQALDRLGAPANAVTPRAPTKEFHPMPASALARFAWDDTQRSDLLSCFQTTGPLKGDPTRLVPVNQTELADFAVSVFACYMNTMLDHYEGDMTIGFSPTVMPVGSLQQVQHTFTADGCFTTLRARGVVPPPTVEGLMSQASRNLLFRNIS